MKSDTERTCQCPTRLLLVEDHLPLAEVTAEFLRYAGLEVRIAESGQEALQAAIAFRPEIVMLDMRLPDMSGLDVARALRSNPHTKNALLAVYTAMSDRDIRTVQSQIPANEVNLFLTKPLAQEDVDKLLAGLATLRRSASPSQNSTSSVNAPATRRTGRKTFNSAA